ncbi:MAG TPA: NAD-dependent epimerase/dehydratase family protein [Candidatus Angelobacter sp.]|nr:NAD-dependent epimerase/dehydratase family protein [Candidatus Angelobacter sp.]
MGEKEISRILITGGNGVIGSHLADKLQAAGESISLLDLKFNANTRFLDCEKIQGDVRDYETVRKVVDGKDAVFHLAAVSRVAWGQEDPFNCWLTNQVGTVNVLEACKKAESNPVLLEASSREVYGEPLYLPVNEGHPKRPKSVYGLTKLCAERACLSYSATSGVDRPVNHVIMRFSNVYGSERDLPERVIPKFMNKALHGEDITLYGGDQVLDFTFIDDTINGIIKLGVKSLEGDNRVIGEDFHFTTGRGVSVYQLANMIIDLVGSRSQVIHGGANIFEVRKFVGDFTKARNILGYEPRVSLEHGLRVLRDRTVPTIIAQVRK